MYGIENYMIIIVLDALQHSLAAWLCQLIRDVGCHSLENSNSDDSCLLAAELVLSPAILTKANTSISKQTLRMCKCYRHIHT